MTTTNGLFALWLTKEEKELLLSFLTSEAVDAQNAIKTGRNFMSATKDEVMKHRFGKMLEASTAKAERIENLIKQLR